MSPRDEPNLRNGPSIPRTDFNQRVWDVFAARLPCHDDLSADAIDATIDALEELGYLTDPSAWWRRRVWRRVCRRG